MTFYDHLEDYERVIGKMSSEQALGNAIAIEKIVQTKKERLVRDFYLARQAMYERYALLLEKAGK